MSLEPVKYERHKNICQELHQTYVNKNTAYGDSFGRSLQKFGNMAAIVRMYDKLERFITLSGGADNKVYNENIEDTLKDLANYAIMTCIELEANKPE